MPRRHKRSFLPFYSWSAFFPAHSPLESPFPPPHRSSLPRESMNGVRWKLSVMMFLEFFIWGAWLPLIFGYLPSMGFTAWEQSLILITFNVAALVALFFGTQFADRNFAAEKFLAFSHLVGGGAILALFFLQAPMGTAVGDFNSVVIGSRGESDSQGVGRLPDGTKVVVDGVD